MFPSRLSKFVFRLLCTLGDKLKPCHFDKSPDEQFNLTRRELEVASVMSESSQYKDVAKKLHISNDTVKMHMSHIYKKLGVSTKHEAILKLQSKILEVLYYNYVQIYLTEEELEIQETKELIEQYRKQKYKVKKIIQV